MLVCIKLLKLLKSSFHLLNCWGQPPQKEDLKKFKKYILLGISQIIAVQCIAQL